MKNALLLLVLVAVVFGTTLLVLRWIGRGEKVSRIDLETEIERSGTVAAEVAAELATSDASELALDADKLRALLLSQISRSSSGRRLLDAARGFEVRIGKGRIDVSLMLAIDTVRVEVDEPRVESAIRFLRMLPGDELRLGVRGKPAVRDEELGLESEGLELLLGPLEVDAGDLEKTLGASVEEIVDGLRVQIGGRPLESVTVDGSRLVLGLRSPASGAG